MEAHEVHKPTEKSVWMGSQFAKPTEWVFELPRTALDEINTYPVLLKASGKPVEEIRTDDVRPASLWTWTISKPCTRTQSS